MDLEIQTPAYKPLPPKSTQTNPNPRKGTMSYETHVTMAINCITTSVYVYAVFELISVCLAMMTIAAKTIPPTDCLSMLFNLWFGIVTLGIIMSMKSLLYALFFSDAAKQKLTSPDCSLIICNKDDSALKYNIYDYNDKTITLAATLFKLSLMANTEPSGSATGPKPSEPTQPTHPAPAATAQSTTPPKSPGTPDSLNEERSQADTETYADAKSEIKPCVD